MYRHSCSSRRRSRRAVPRAFRDAAVRVRVSQGHHLLVIGIERAGNLDCRNETLAACLRQPVRKLGEIEPREMLEPQFLQEPRLESARQDDEVGQGLGGRCDRRDLSGGNRPEGLLGPVSWLVTQELDVACRSTIT